MTATRKAEPVGNVLCREVLKPEHLLGNSVHNGYRTRPDVERCDSDKMR